jgi:tRNA pseudouridine55 synthase
MYSALSVGGKRLYDLAREGIEIERAARDVEIKELRLLEKLSDTDYKIEVLCSKGTYIRTLCSDVGDALSCGGCMSELRRTAVGVFTEKEAMSLEEVERLHAEGRLSERIAPADALFRDLPAVVLNDFGEKRAKNGAFLEKEALKSGELPPEGELCRVYAQNGDFLMLAVTKKLDHGPDAAFCYRTFKTQG